MFGFQFHNCCVSILGIMFGPIVSSYWLRFTTVFWVPFLRAIYCPPEPFVGHFAVLLCFNGAKTK